MRKHNKSKKVTKYVTVKAINEYGLVIGETSFIVGRGLQDYKERIRQCQKAVRLLKVPYRSVYSFSLPFRKCTQKEIHLYLRRLSCQSMFCSG